MRPLRVSLILFLLLAVHLHDSAAQPPDARRVRAPKPAPRLGTPEQLLVQDVHEFIGSLNGEHPFMSAQKQVWEARIGFFGASEWQRWWLRERGEHLLKVEKVQVDRITATEAEITVAYRTSPQQEQPWIEGPFTMKFGFSPLDPEKAQNQVWQFVPLEPKEDEYLVSHPVRWAVWTLGQSPAALPAFRTVVAVDNLKKLGIAALQLAQDFNESFALLPEFREEALDPYLANPALWLVPGTNEKVLFNERLSGKSSNNLAQPARTILFYDGANEKPVYRYNGKTAICLTDGHVELADPEQFKSFHWE